MCDYRDPHTSERAARASEPQATQAHIRVRLSCAQARLQTKFLKMLMEQGYGAPVESGGRFVFQRPLHYGTVEEVPVTSVRSHIIKHGASDNAAASGVPMSVSMQASAPPTGAPHTSDPPFLSRTPFGRDSWSITQTNPQCGSIRRRRRLNFPSRGRC
jgi:hypothetical protein